MALSRIATVIGGILLSKGGRRFAGRNAGKLALATLAFELWQNRRKAGAAGTAKSRTPPRGTGSATPRTRRRR